MKKKGIIILISILLIFIGLPLLVLNSPTVQRKILHAVTENISKRSGMIMDMDGTSVNLLRGVVFHEVTIKDSTGIPLFKAEKLEAGIKFIPLFRKKIDIYALRFIKSDFTLSKARPEDELNLQKFLKAFEGGKGKKSAWQINFRSILLRRCNLSYNVFSERYKVNGFDPDHFSVKDISSVIKLDMRSGKIVAFNIKKFNATGPSGLKLDKIHFFCEMNGKSIKIRDLDIETRNSTIEIPSIVAFFRSKNAFKNFADSVYFSPFVVRASLTPSDFSGFSPELSKMTNAVKLSVAAEGRLSNISINSLRMNVENMMSLDGKIRAKNLPEIKNLVLNGKIELLRLYPEGVTYLSSLISRKNNSKVPEQLYSLGTINYMGSISTIGERFILKGDFSTAAGNIETDVELGLKKNNSIDYQGNFNTNSFNLAKLFSGKNSYGNIALNFSVNGTRTADKRIKGTAQGIVSQMSINGYNYKGLSLDGEFDNESVKGDLSSNDENVRFDFNGLVNFSKNAPAVKCQLNVDRLNLKALNLIQDKGISELSFSSGADLKGNNIDNITGIVNIDNFDISGNGQRLKVNKFIIEKNNSGIQKNITVKSDLLSGEMNGRFSLDNLRGDIKYLISEYMPSFLSVPVLKNPNSDNDIDFHFAVQPSEALVKIIGFPFEIYKTSNFDGFYKSSTGKFRLRAQVPDMTYGNTDIYSFNILLENPGVDAKLIAHAQAGTIDNLIDVDIDSRIKDNQSLLKLFWSNSDVKTHTGTINSILKFGKDAYGKPVIDAGISPSRLVFNDSIWQLYPSEIKYEAKRIKIKQFQLRHNDEFVKVDGVASVNSEDTLSISLNSFSIDDIFAVVPNAKTTFGGNVTGTAVCPHFLKSWTMDAALKVKGFSINKEKVGDVVANSYWDKDKKALALNADVYSDIKSDNLRKVAKGNGFFYPVGDSLDLNLLCDRLPLRSLRSLIKGTLSNIDGFGYGNVRIYGPLKKIGVYTNSYFDNASFSIDAINTTYHFSDSIHITPSIISFRNVKLKDRDGNQAIASGILHHNHFKDFNLGIDIKAKKMLVIDIPPSRDKNFAGCVYGTGTVSINGPKSNTLIDVNMRTEEKTKVLISLSGNSQVTETGFISFVQPSVKEDTLLALMRKKYENKEDDQTTSGNSTVNLQIEATPSAELTVITDPSSGDEIRATGSGALRAVINKDKSIELFGRYSILNGSYRFIYENILRRNFEIQNGSSINFTGNPLAAQLDITANYTVNARISDLLPQEELSSLNLTRTNIPVNTVLNISGELQRPDIGLGLNFPSADEELRRRIMNVINTDEALNQQIVFLLLFSRFSNTTNAYTTSQSNLSTVLNTTFSTLSSQFNRMLSSALGYSNLNFDFNYQNASYEAGTPGEWEVGMSGKLLDDRLSFQGNVGSREDLTKNGSSQFIGEFDISLRMKNSEKWSWKLFNRANDNRYFKSALNTQGFGVVYKENYNSLSELFKGMLESLRKPFVRKKEKKGELTETTSAQ